MNVRFPNGFPKYPPKFEFATKIYHINISTQGKIYLPLFASAWSHENTMVDVVDSIAELLEGPILSHAINDDAKTLFLSNENEYNKRAEEWKNAYSKKQFSIQPTDSNFTMVQDQYNNKNIENQEQEEKDIPVKEQKL